MQKITAIITTHAEGDLLIASVESCFAAANRFGGEIELILAMDRPNVLTRLAVEKIAKNTDLIIVELDYGDQGLVRNHLINISTGDYIAFLDGDDLWSENWLYLAYEASRKYGENTVIYPEFNWFFEGSNNILVQTDSESEIFDIEALRSTNLWDALCFCPANIYKMHQFGKRRVAEGFAFEDWHWNKKIFEAGYKQMIAKDTIIFKRRRANSQGAEASKRGVITEPTPSSYFDYYQSGRT